MFLEKRKFIKGSINTIISTS
uniref:Uncharacterized protein n=1 Tax=Tetranychus urticae TaxID=32264 RepID=T1JZH2_TETUR